MLLYQLTGKFIELEPIFHLANGDVFRANEKRLNVIGSDDVSIFPQPIRRYLDVHHVCGKMCDVY